MYSPKKITAKKRRIKIQKTTFVLRLCSRSTEVLLNLSYTRSPIQALGEKMMTQIAETNTRKISSLSKCPLDRFVELRKASW